MFLSHIMKSQLKDEHKAERHVRYAASVFCGDQHIINGVEICEEEKDMWCQPFWSWEPIDWIAWEY